jgi:predicted O-methyltransferase YrrM
MTTPPREKLRDPLCNTMLFDKMLAHRKVNYIADTQSNGSNTNSGHITAADILMTAMVTPWLDAFTAESDFISRTIPSIVRYVQRVRREVRHLCKDPERVINEDSLLYVERYCGPKTSWVDRAEILVAQGNVVNFAQNAKVKRQQRNSETGQCGDAELRLINETAELLLTRIPWRDTADLVEASDVCTSSALFCAESELWQHMCLPAGREQRKRQQVVSLLEHALALLPAGGVAVEFCSGGGYVGIPLAYVRRDCTVLLTDMNAVSLQFARQRVEALGLRNVRFLRCELTDIAAIMDGTIVSTEEASSLLQAFNLGLALHACGGATDTVLELCRRRDAACVVAPCCYGFLQHCTAAARTVKRWSDELLLEAENPSLEESCTIGPEGGSRCSDHCGEVTPIVATGTERVYPQSEEFRAQGWQPRWFSSLCRRADRTFWAHDARAAQHNTAGALAMRVVDTDRLLWLREAGYEVYAAFMRPKEASVKNHILVGRRK